MANVDIGGNSWYSSVPEYEMEGMWTCDIQDDKLSPPNDIEVGNYMPKGFDNYVQNVSIPQLSLGYKITNFGFPSFDEKSSYSEVTINFYDDTEGSCLAFFTDWLHTIYDEQKNCVKPNWRYQTKTIIVEYFRTFNYRNNITEKDFSNRIKRIKRYKMVKCLPMSLSEISADDDGGDRKTFSVQIATQKVYNLMAKTGFNGE